MTDQEVQLFLADLAIIIIILLARLLGKAAKRLGQPPVLGEASPASC
jgi:Kef-type K+ transport system membrane component KefB